MTRRFAGDDFPADRGVQLLREFLAETAIRAGTVTSKEARHVWGRFVPTTIRLADPLDEHDSYLSLDVDGSDPTAFLTGLKIVDRVRRYPAARLQQVAVRTYLALPARYTEVAERADYLRSIHHPMEVGPGRPDSEETIFRLLTARERIRLQYIPLDEKVGLAALMASRRGPVVAFSPDGLWPRHPLVREITERLERWFIRRKVAEIPPAVRRRIRCVRYLPVEAPCESIARAE